MEAYELDKIKVLATSFRGAIDGNFSSIPEQQLHAAGVHVEFASSCIVLHTRVLLKSCCGLCRSIYDFGFHLPRTPALNFPKKTNNPNPSPIGKKFGFCCCGAPPGTRTLGPLIKRANRRFVSIYGSFELSLFLIKST